MRNDAPLETTITKKVIAALNAIPNCLVKKHHGSPFGHTELDIYGSVAGRAVFIEVKRPGGKPTPRQVKTIERWREVGAIAGVVTSADEAIALVMEAAA